ncbi:unnamed protein product [Durusdinium trenchii]|uniref:Uncharacterized protein n=1 Tax=Durusdinium trenchii TaxID=1381693 RepID=A0ABP0HES1_9DINO
MDSPSKESPRKSPDTLPISSFRGPEVNVPWSERAELTLEQKLEDAAQRLQVAQEELQQQEQHVGSGRYPLTLKTRKQEPDFASRAADAQRMLRIQRDPRFLELQEALNAQTAEVQKPEKKSFMGTRETKESWKQQLSDGLRKLIQTVNMSLDPSMAEKQLENVYRWYVASRPGFSGAPCQAGDAPSPGRPAEMGFYNFCADEVLRHPAPPGSAYFTKEDHEGDLMTSQSVERVEEADTVKMLAGRPMAEARLASPKERLKDFSTRAIVRPLTARKLKDLAGERPEEPNRPLTPSTTEGGFTARSLVSARSTAVAGVSRPTSAMSMAQSAVSRGATPTPRSVARRPQSAASVDSVVPPLPQTVEENTNPAPEEYTLPYPGTEAEWNMERRWMLRRNRAITDKVMGQERNSALRAWAERRARVEEEISRTAEATRFQCALKDRRYIEPPDAEEDIEATVTCEDESSSRPSHTPAVRRSDPPRIDVSQPQVFSQVTRFAVEKPKQKPLNSRIAHLRRIHAHLLADAQISDPDSEEDRGERDNSAECNTLSAYAPTAPPPRREDDSDVLIGVCDWWKHFHADPDQQDGTSAVLDEMRFHQMQEVEEIKRVFSIRNVPLNVPVLERALVMPAHKMNPGHLNGIYLVNTHPDLLSNPFIAKKKKKLKKKRGKSAKKGKAKSRSSSAKGKKK